MYNYNYCDFYAQKLQERLILMKGKKGEETLLFLFNNLDNWLPSRLVLKGITFTKTNNRP